MTSTWDFLAYLKCKQPRHRQFLIMLDITCNSSASRLFSLIETVYVILVLVTRAHKYFNIELVLHDQWLIIFTRLANTCSCPLKASAIKNIGEKYVIWLPRVILPKAFVLQDECFVKNYSSFLDFTRNYEWTSGILSPDLIAEQQRLRWICRNVCHSPEQSLLSYTNNGCRGSSDQSLGL